MKKMLILTILGSGILFGCGNSEIKNAEVPITPEIEQATSKENKKAEIEPGSEIDFKSYAEIIKALSYEDGFISMEEFLEVDSEIAGLVDKSFFGRMLKILNTYNKKYDNLGLTVEQFDKKIKAEK